MPKKAKETEEEKLGRLLRKNASKALKIMAATMEDDSVKPELRIQCCKEILTRYDREEGESCGTICVEMKGEAEDFAK
ncbi:MAG: hypothetical protein J6B40_07225 [Oscillospiraceae bacterium]|nr:hypothetical protein [Oscillospiraceae bacterium]MBQ8670801.1 hypothetical protein [Oscillospiraceae bacterium]MBQ9109004.1 hypothetical protein [Oscillospiraceae bacterium]